MNECWYLLDSEEKETSGIFPNGILDKKKPTKNLYSVQYLKFLKMTNVNATGYHLNKQLKDRLLHTVYPAPWEMEIF